MFLYVSDKILSNKDLNASEKLLLGLISSLDHNQRECFMSNSQLASSLGFSRRQVIRMLDHLEKLGLIEIKYTESKGVYSNRTITLKKIQVKRDSELMKLFDIVMHKIK